jgi:hypothetical protein
VVMGGGRGADRRGRGKGKWRGKGRQARGRGAAKSAGSGTLGFADARQGKDGVGAHGQAAASDPGNS